MKLVVSILFFIVTVGFVSGAFAQIQLDSGKIAYSPGETVDVSGTAVGAHVVAIEVKDSSGNTILLRTVTPDSSGYFDLSFKVPQSSSGSIQIIASGNVDGQATKQTEIIKISAKQDFTPEGPAPTSQPEPSNGGCLIATAAYGTELAPQIQFLREVRDHTVMSTTSGAAFMTAFNQFYYSFSPTIADWERQNPAFQETIRVFISPMISTLSIMTLADSGSEVQVLGAGISVIMLNLGMYVAAPAIVGYKLRKYNHTRKL